MGCEDYCRVTTFNEVSSHFQTSNPLNSVGNPLILIMWLIVNEFTSKWHQNGVSHILSQVIGFVLSGNWRNSPQRSAVMKIVSRRRIFRKETEVTPDAEHEGLFVSSIMIYLHSLIPATRHR